MRLCLIKVFFFVWLDSNYIERVYKITLYIVGSHCSNCTNRVSADKELCSSCESKQLCVRCNKRKGVHSFDIGSLFCKRCVRWVLRPPRRSALNDTVVEHDLQCFELDVDLSIFLARNHDRIIEIIQGGLTQHA